MSPNRWSARWPDACKIRQWSLDGCSWLDGDVLITEKTANGVHTGVLNNANQSTPFCRLVVEVRNTISSNQVGANISTWGYYQYS